MTFQLNYLSFVNYEELLGSYTNEDKNGVCVADIARIFIFYFLIQI